MVLFHKKGYFGHFRAQKCGLKVQERVYLGFRYLQQTLKPSVYPVNPIYMHFSLIGGFFIVCVFTKNDLFGTESGPKSG